MTRARSALLLGLAATAAAACYSATGDDGRVDPRAAAPCTGPGCQAAAISDAGSNVADAPAAPSSPPSTGGSLMDAEAMARCPGVDLDKAPRLANAGGRFVAGGLSEHSVVSNDGAHWGSDQHVVAADAASPHVGFIGIAAGPGLFVGAAYSAILTSPDGTTWTRRPHPPVYPGTWWENGYNAAAYGNGIYVVAANATNGFLMVYHSTDGIDWTGPASYVQNASFCCRPIHGMTFANGKFVAVGVSRRSVVSEDGINWHDDMNPTDGNGNDVQSDYMSVAFGNGVFVAVGTRSAIAHSTNGIDWTEADASKPVGDFRSVVFDGSKFLTCVRTGCYTSPDGATWTAVASAVGDPRPTVAMIYRDGLYVGIDIPAQILASNDGATWTPVYCGAPPGLRSLAFLPAP